MSKARIDDMFAQEFKCPKCKSMGAHAERLAMPGTGITRYLDIQPYRYTFLSCHNCGYTEIFNLKMLEGKDNLGTLIDIIFSG